MNVMAPTSASLTLDSPKVRLTRQRKCLSKELAKASSTSAQRSRSYPIAVRHFHGTVQTH